jgi:hypothetical protein
MKPTDIDPGVEIDRHRNTREREQDACGGIGLGRS